jgi:hypothetical protein
MSVTILGSGGGAPSRRDTSCVDRFRDLLGAALPARELERLAHVDALLRLVAAEDLDRIFRRIDGLG